MRPSSPFIGGWQRQPHDGRDWPLPLLAPLPGAPPPPAPPQSVDLAPQFAGIEVYDQGQLGSCTANAGCFLVEALAQSQGKSELPSRLFVYYKTRHSVEHTGRGDNGATLRGTAKELVKFGAPPEVDDPYVVSRFDRRPKAVATRDAKQQLVTAYYAVDPPGTSPQQRLQNIKLALAAGHPVMFGMDVYEDIESPEVAASGMLPYPHAGGPIGGHAIVFVGYDDRTGKLKVRNSWSAGWGLDGYFYIDYREVTDGNATDCWVFTSEEVLP